MLISTRIYDREPLLPAVERSQAQPLNHDPSDCPKRVHPCTETACLSAALTCAAG